MIENIGEKLFDAFAEVVTTMGKIFFFVVAVWCLLRL
jgi:hypothetical protein